MPLKIGANFVSSHSEHSQRHTQPAVEGAEGLVEAAADPRVGHVEGEGVPGLVHGEEVADKR